MDDIRQRLDESREIASGTRELLPERVNHPSTLERIGRSD